MERGWQDFTKKLWEKNNTYLQEFRSCCKIWKKQTDKEVLLDSNQNSNINEKL